VEVFPHFSPHECDFQEYFSIFKFQVVAFNSFLGSVEQKCGPLKFAFSIRYTAFLKIVYSLTAKQLQII
jgi:hypothetical protein